MKHRFNTLPLWGVLIRHTVYKALLLFLAVGVMEGIFFFLGLNSQWMHPSDGISVYSLAFLVNEVHLATPFRFGMIGMTILLLYTGGSGRDATLHRLGYPKGFLSLTVVLHSMLWYWLYYCFQAVLGVVFTMAYHAVIDPAYLSPHALFLSFYRVPLFHTAFPLHHILMWVQNGIVFLALGLTVAANSHMIRRKKRPLSAMVLTFFVVLFSVINELENDSAIAVTILVAIAFGIFAVIQMATDANQTEEEAPPYENT